MKYNIKQFYLTFSCLNFCDCCECFSLKEQNFAKFNQQNDVRGKSYLWMH